MLGLKRFKMMESIIRDIFVKRGWNLGKKGDLSISTIVVLILAAVFLVISVSIIILSKGKAGGAIAYVKQLFNFG